MLDLRELERWRLYMLVPHHYVTQCLIRYFVSSGALPCPLAQQAFALACEGGGAGNLGEFEVLDMDLKLPSWI